MKYLYGASVKGIQEYIFSTNELKEIIGASELIKSFESRFKEIVNNEKDILLNAAGNMRAVVDENKLKKIVFDFVENIRRDAIGIEIVQGAVKIQGNTPTKKDFMKLEEKLRIQRNKPTFPYTFALSVVRKSRRTSNPAIMKDKDDFLDLSNKQKRESYTKFLAKNPSEIELKELKSISNNKNKIAVVHIDGNGLGEVVMELGDKINEFSRELNKITYDCYDDAKKEVKNGKIRTVILGGDDVTAIVDATYALKFVNAFIKCFEKNTEEKLNYKLTACVGITYINEKYPFYYAVHLAEELISEAKNYSKKFKQEQNLKEIPSSVNFYAIQSGNFYDYEVLKQNELKVNDISFEFGPYFIDEKYNKPTLSELLDLVFYFRDDSSPSSKFREWLKLLDYNKEYANRVLKRVDEIAKSKWKYYKEFQKIIKRWRCKDMLKDNKTPIYDILQIKSVME